MGDVKAAVSGGERGSRVKEVELGAVDKRVITWYR